MRHFSMTLEHEHTLRAARAVEELMPGWKSLVSSDGRYWKLTRGIWGLVINEDGEWCCHNGKIYGTGATPRDAVAEAARKLTARYSQDMEALTGKKL